MRRASEIKFGIEYELGSNKSTILLAGSDFSFKQPSQLSFSRFTILPMPSGIATKTDDMDQSGSAMVQAKHEVVNEKEVNFLLSGRVLMLVL